MTETKHECTGWSLVLTITRPDGTWFDKTITDFKDDNVSISISADFGWADIDVHEIEEKK